MKQPDKIRTAVLFAFALLMNLTIYPVQAKAGSGGILAAALCNADATASQWVIADGEIQRNTNGSGRVKVVFKPPDNRMEIRQVRLYGTGENARSRLSTQLLDQLRRRLK